MAVRAAMVVHLSPLRGRNASSEAGSRALIVVYSRPVTMHIRVCSRPQAAQDETYALPPCSPLYAAHPKWECFIEAKSAGRFDFRKYVPRYSTMDL